MNVLGVLPFARFLIENTLEPGDCAIDCTVGNGHDTVFLAKLVGENGHVYGFDIQAEAISSTTARLNEEKLNDRVTLFQIGHEHVLTTIPEQKQSKMKAAIFNLGYLPGGDKSIVTKPSSTVAAIRSLLAMMPKGGTIVLVIYHGHEEGQIEKDRVSYFRRTNRSAHSSRIKV